MGLAEDQHLKENVYIALLKWITFPILKYNTEKHFVIFLNFGDEAQTKFRNWQSVSL